MSPPGEFELIARLTAALPQGQGVALGIGDDTAALQPTPGMLLLATTDALVEDVHYRHSWMAPEDIGHKAAAINLSDMAAMGGLPRWALASLGLPPDYDPAWLERCYAGMTGLLAQYGAALVGGNISSARQLFLDITLLGEVEPRALARRSAARPGQLVVVTGSLGEAAAGLALLEAGVATEHWMQPLLQAQRRPQPRVREGRALAHSGRLGAMLDLSDGIASDLRHIALQSHVGAVIHTERLPISAAVRQAAALLGRDPLGWALSGGEDYQLLFTCAPEDYPQLRAMLSDLAGITPVGEILPDQQGLVIEHNGQRRPLEPGGWDHFRSC